MILIKNIRYLVKNADEVLEDVDVLIDGNRISKIGRDLSGYRHATVIDATNKILSPGFVNMHTHLYQNMLKGMRDDLLIKDWCEQVTFPLCGIINKYADKNDTDLSYYYGILGAVEQIRCGITAFGDMDVIQDSLFEAWEDVGIRGCGAIQAFNRWVPAELSVTEEEQKQQILDLIKKWHGKGLQRVAIAPSTPFACTPDYLRWLVKTGGEQGVNIYCHISETKWEIDQSLNDVGMTPLEYMESEGALCAPLLAVHAVHFTEEEMELCKKRNVTVCYNPQSNMKLGSGIAPISEYLKKGIPCVMATDGAASNDLLDMFEDMRTGLMMQKLRNGCPECMNANDIFRMATENGAKFFGIDAGVIEEGKLADVILLDTTKAHFGPVHDVIQNIVYCGKENDVETVIINGRIVLRDGVMQTIDEKVAVANAMKMGSERHKEALSAINVRD